VSTLCNQEAGQKNGGFFYFAENRLYNSRLKVFFRVGTFPDYDMSGNTDTAPSKPAESPLFMGMGGQERQQTGSVEPHQSGAQGE
jgi:hypothetical protein